jgi:hypothetical protein
MAKFWIKSTDSGVPTCTGQNGSVSTLCAYLAGVASLSVPYTGTNKCIIQTSTGSVIRAVHDSTVSGAAQLCTVRAAESASGIDTYADAFPLVSLVADNSCNVLASTTASSTARAWWCLIDTTKHCFFLLIDAAGAGAISSGIIWYRGVSVFSADPYAEWIHIRNSTSSNSPNFPPFEQFANNSPSGTWGLWGMRTKDGVTKSVRCSYGPYFGSQYPSGGQACQPAPSGDGDMRLDRIFITDYATQGTTADTTRAEPKRAYVPNVFVPLHSISNYSSYTCGEVFNVAAYDPDIDLAFFPFTGSTGSRGAIVIEISDPP